MAFPFSAQFLLGQILPLLLKHGFSYFEFEREGERDTHVHACLFVNITTNQSLNVMQTQITIPAEIIDAAHQLAQQLGLSPDEFFTTAISDFIHKYGDADITANLNRIYTETASALDPVLTMLQLKSLPEEQW
jgi:hypothetical protein